MLEACYQAFKAKEGLLMQIGFYLGSLIGASAFFFVVTSMITEGLWWLPPAAMVIMSPAAMAFLRVWYEEPFKLTRDFVDPLVMSRAFVFGDFVFLPLVLLFAARGWSEYHSFLVDSTGFLFACLAFGYMAAAAFVLVDGPRYVKAGVPSARFSPTKVWHDWAVMPGVVAILVWVLLPQIKQDSPIETMVAVLFLLCFGLLVIMDAKSPVNPRGQHPAWDVANFETALQPGNVSKHL